MVSFLLFSRWEDDWWCFFENYWSLTLLQPFSLPLWHIEPVLSAINLPDRLHTAHNGFCTVEVFSISLRLVPSLLLALFTRWVAWQNVVLMSLWSTFQEATYYSVYECVEFISVHCCGHIKELKSCYIARLLSLSSVILPLEFEKKREGISDTSYWTHWIFLATHGHFQWHMSSLPEQHLNSQTESFP